ncbi:MAG: DnaJ domain-containing protein [Verrucomicrobia bacterium]|nr:DnaJ domain-containing protein [Verrucomicrobiota bacterium]|tara:strand:+ start:15648 stop:16217 length:570 start_codon:yes stop_codon:yes gene_type:complete
MDANGRESVLMNSFEWLGLPVGLVVSDEEIRDAFRTKASDAHPDSGGDEVEFAAMQAAQEVLFSPARRLKEWLEVKGWEVDSRGMIDSGVMDLFQEVAGVGSEAEAAVKAKDKAQSALAKGMAEISLMSAREKVGALLSKIVEEIEKRVSCFPEIEEKGDASLGAKVMRDLVFLEKWRGTLRGLFGRLM